MTWTAPHVDRRPHPYGPRRTAQPHAGDERAALELLLDWHRETLLRKCAGLIAEQLKRHSAEPSDLSLLGLVRHLTNVERHWFWDFAGQLEPAYATGDDPGEWTDFADVAGADPAADLAEFQRTCHRSRELVAGAALDDTFVQDGLTFSLRWLYLHMIEEYARHNGHADLLRERIDGATGQ